MTEYDTYKDYLETKHNRKIKTLDVEIDGDFANLRYTFEPVPFNRIRRITGYLVASTEQWNNAKLAELNDRVTHSTMERI